MSGSKVAERRVAMDITDIRIVELFTNRSKDAVSVLSKKYEKLCRSISYNILGNREDAEECVNDTYLKVWDSIPPAKPDNLTAYVCRIVRNISLDKLRYNLRSKRNGKTDTLLSELSECIPSQDNVEESADDTLKNAITDFLDGLSDRDRKIFIRRYFFCDDVKSISKRLGVTETNVTTILNRTRNNLKKYLSDNGIAV